MQTGKPLMLALTLLTFAIASVPRAEGTHGNCPPSTYAELPPVGPSAGYVSIAESYDWYRHDGSAVPGVDFLFTLHGSLPVSQSIMLHVYNASTCALVCYDYGNGACLISTDVNPVWVRVGLSSTLVALGGVDYVLGVSAIPE